MAEQRIQRDNDTRAQVERPSDKWVPAPLLPVPKPEAGWVFRWIRTSMVGSADNTNVSQKFREGWIPCKADDYKDLEIQSDIGSRFKGNIEVGGLLLCKAPESEMAKRQKYYEDMAGQQMESVDQNYLRENDPRMPLLNPERTTRTSFGSN